MLGLVALLLAFAAAGWFLFRVARSGGVSARDGANETLFKGVAFLAIIAVLGAAKLWPLAFMVLLASAAILGTELWRARAIAAENAADSERASAPQVSQSGDMEPDEAFSVLGVSKDAGADEIKAAYKKLISKLHPDIGGTDFLATQINRARETALAALETRVDTPPVANSENAGEVKADTEEKND